MTGMLTLALIGLVGGLITGVSPCVLPMLPIIFVTAGTPGQQPSEAERRANRGRPFKIILGVIVAFSIIALAGSSLLAALGLPDSFLRWTGLVVLSLVGIGLIFPPLGHLIERPFYRLPKLTKNDSGPFVLGLGLGTLYVPCAGPVLAAITVAGATGHVGWKTVVLTIAFAIGAALPLLVFAAAGSRIAERVRAYRRRDRQFRIGSGIVLIALAVALAFNLTDVLQRAVPDYTAGLQTKVADSSAIQGALNPLSSAINKDLVKCKPGSAAFAKCGTAPPIQGISHWYNTPGGKAVSLKSLKGHVVLIDFWAYSCINCQRELPHVEAWARAYASDGLEVIGVHTPEYAFEHVPSNVAAGVRRLGLTFPVALDNSYGTWNAYDNQSWPAAYLIDASGQIRHVSIGEGDYGGEEQLIRQLLSAAHPGIALPRATDVPDTTPDDSAQTPETYLGAERQQGYHGSTPYASGQFTAPGTLPANSFALAGAWTIGQESITAGKGAGITLAFHASKVYLDVGGTGTLTVSAGGTSQVIRVSGAPDIYTVATEQPARDGTVTIRLSPGLQAYSFTFG